MLLHHKNAVIYGGGGAVGGALARTFAREGANVFLVGRTPAALERVRDDVHRAGGVAFTALVDALDEREVTEHADAAAEQAGSISIVVNAIGVPHVQGARLHELTPEEFLRPIEAYTRSTFVTARATAPHMVRAGCGVILTISTPGARLAVPGTLGNAAASAAVEAMTRTLSAELGPSGVRVVCLRPDVIPEALATSHVGRIFEVVAARAGADVETVVSERARLDTLLGRLPTLDHVADYAAFAASDRAGALTGAIANLSGGSLVD